VGHALSLSQLPRHGIEPQTRTSLPVLPTSNRTSCTAHPTSKATRPLSLRRARGWYCAVEREPFYAVGRCRREHELNNEDVQVKAGQSL
jgi:hypothetical protein